MKGADHGVGAVPFGLGRQERDQDPDEQPAQGRGQRHQPEPVGADELVRHAAFGGEARWPVPRDALEEDALDQVEQQLKEDGADRAEPAEEECIEEEPTLVGRAGRAPGHRQLAVEARDRTAITTHAGDPERPYCTR